jgi:hypothetical protein
MKILFVAKHDSGDNDDENAVTHALEALGHDVDRVHELRKHRTIWQTAVLEQATHMYDFCLFFKWGTVSEIAALQCPSVFWFFDMVRPVDGDPTLSARSEHRIGWMRDVLALPKVRLGFCTDGDWVDADLHGSGKLRWLMQGADERTLGFGTPIPNYDGPEILFTGMINHGQKRARHIGELQDRYGGRFGVLGAGGPQRRVHGRSLADVFASTKIVVAPDGPNTDRYWSNRVYLTTGLGGLLLHPYCERLTIHYSPNELMCYLDRDELNWLIDKLLEQPDERRVWAINGYEACRTRNLYRHRCEQLIKEVEKVL